jgi:carboxylate-amine ligase
VPLFELIKKKLQGFTPKPRAATDTLNLDFKENEHLTIGVEVELQIIDKKTFALADRSDELIEKLKDKKQFVPELFKSIIEINSSVHKNLHELSPEMRELIGLVEKEADALGCAVMGSGCHPTMHYEDLGTREAEGKRYAQLVERNQWLMRRWMVSGMHIHMAMKSAEECMRFMLYFEHYIPHFIVLSASSPYWHGSDTGLRSCRSIISESIPTAALMYTVNSWPELQELVRNLTKSKAITSLKDLHWDIRPSPAYGTLELRVCDMPTNLQDVVAISAFAHTLALWFSNNGEWLTHMPKPQMWMARENKWRALRYGAEAEIVITPDGTTVPIKQDFEKIFERIAETAKAHGYIPYLEHLKTILAQGSSSDRQRAVFANTGSLQSVIAHNLKEFQEGLPVYPVAEEPKPLQQKASA